jgi:phenylalanyl-tRNA synthetase beta chain
MLISLEWLREYAVLPDDLDAPTLAHELTLRTVEVEHFRTLSIPGRMVVGRVAESETAADGSQLVTLDVGRPELEPARADGVLLPNTLCAVELAGTSGSAPATQSRVLSLSDLGLAALAPGSAATAPLVFGPDYGFGDAAASAKSGSSAAELLKWNDIVIEIDNKSLTNRPDLWSHYGVARELAAIFGGELLDLKTAALPAQCEDASMIDLVDETLCRQIATVAIDLPGGRQRPTPFLLRSRLGRVGQRSLGFYADLTNYVMLGIGHPAHVYDRGRLTLPLSVRPAGRAEEHKLLSGQTVAMASSTAVIADVVSVVAAAGVAGTEVTQVADETEAVLLEVANFDPIAVRRSTQALQVRTDASSRFDKNLDTDGTSRALGHILHLVARFDPEAKILCWAQRSPRPTEPVAVATSIPFINKRLGTELDGSGIAALLRPLGFAVTEVSDSGLAVGVPPWRSTGDVAIPHDILEEVARMIGYDNLPVASPRISLRQGKRAPAYALDRRIREFLAHRCQAQEVLTYPWAVDRYLEALGFETTRLLSIEAAPSPDRTHLRPSLLPNLLSATEEMLPQFENFAMFELGSVYLAGTESDLPVVDEAASREALPPMARRLAAVFVGSDLGGEFRRASGAAGGLGRAAWVPDLALQPSSADDSSWGDPVAALSVVTGGVSIGRLAAIDLSVVLGVRTDRAAVAFELELNALVPASARPNQYEPVSQFPESSVDLSIIVRDGVSWAEIAHELAKAETSHVRRVGFVDEFRGGSVPIGHRSITLRLHLADPKRTLAAADKAAAREQAEILLRSRLHLEVRG